MTFKARRAVLIGVALTMCALAKVDAQPAPASPPETTPIRTAIAANGLVADLYTPGEPKGLLSAVIVLGGSEGGLGKVSAWEAWLLAAHGFAALQVSYFDGPGQSHRFADIPLEYFGSAIDWLRQQPTIDGTRIGIMGASRGGEAALLVAAHYPAIRVVVAAMPSSVVWPGIGRGLTTSAFSLAGKPLPFLTVPAGGFTSIYDFFVKGLLTLDQHPDAAIPVEAIDGPVMLICGEQDRLWPSCPMSRQIEARLKDKGFTFDVQLLAYEDAGHYGFGPPLPSDSASFVNAGGLGGLGGSAAGNASAQRDSWPRAIAFLDAALRGPGR